MAETHVVCRLGLPVGGGKVLPAGTRVDARDWRNLEALMRSGYIRPLLAEEVQQTRPIRSKG